MCYFELGMYVLYVPIIVSSDIFEKKSQTLLNCVPDDKSV